MRDWKATARQIHELERRLREARSAREYRRLMAVLEVARGKPILRISQQLGVARQSIYNWIDTYCSCGQPEVLFDPQEFGRPSIWTEQLQRTLEDAIQQSPSEWGHQAGAWTVGLLQDHLESQTGAKPSDSSLRRQMHGLGYVWKRGRYVLDPDPQREKKTANPPEGRTFVYPECSSVRG